MSKSESSCGKTKAFSIKNACKSSNLMKNLRSVIETHPNECAKHLGMSIMYLINDEHDKMLDCLKFLAQNHPDVALIHRRIAEIYINQNDFETAISYLEESIRLNGDDVTAKIWLSLSYYAINNDAKAAASLKSLKEDIFLIHAANTNWFDENE